ncbi:uncharacterized protein BKCO1_3400024 [Diplodia corticola]|uniref:Uncharacterized protein n=1 Tax=Diplodia corticola TaxID=236234 RepID=A0A1J9QXA0_9PEZI|nr:uncharacterized protein BKCO1_3400024 [Diplodia corticola]OJD33024.1 hypothetical protein BKCO1_3400024 [Diplodia corticola]
MSLCNDVVALTTAATWMTLSGTALSSSIHVLTRAFIGYLVFCVVDLKFLEPITDDDADDDDDFSRRSLRLYFCGVGLLGLLTAHIVLPGLRRLWSLVILLPSAQQQQQQQQQMPGAWPSPWSWFAPSLPPSPLPSPALANGNENWEADHLAKMDSLPVDCFISPAALAARGKRGYTCPSYDDDDSAHGPGLTPVTKSAAKGEPFVFGLGMGPLFAPSLPSIIQPAPAPAEKEKEEKEAKEEEEREENGDRVPWTHDGLLDPPSEYGFRARFRAAAAADAALLAARGPGARYNEAEGEVRDVERTGDSASRRPAISGSSSFRPISSQRYRSQPSRPCRRHLSSFPVTQSPRVIVLPPSPVLSAPVSPLSPPLFLLSRRRKGNRSRKWRTRRLLRSESMIDFSGFYPTDFLF